jgi:hypothetical protein
MCEVLERKHAGRYPSSTGPCAMAAPSVIVLAFSFIELARKIETVRCIVGVNDIHQRESLGR